MTGVILLSAGLALAGAARSDTGAPRPFRIVVAFSDEPCPAGSARLGKVATESDELADVLGRVAKNAEVVRLPEGPPDRRRPLDGAELRRVVGADRRPLWLIYSGHATVRGGRSFLCLANRELLPVADVLASIAPETPFATVMLNACSSAFVDPRRPNLVVISASPDEVGTTFDGSVLGSRLLRALRGRYDRDGDGVFTSAELFAALRGAAVNNHPVQTKLRAQSLGPLPLFGVPRADSMPAVWPGEEQQPSPAEPAIAHDGRDACRYTRPVRATDRAWLEARGLAACPCADDSGQCFCGRDACR